MSLTIALVDDMSATVLMFLTFSGRSTWCRSRPWVVVEVCIPDGTMGTDGWQLSRLTWSSLRRPSVRTSTMNSST